MPGVTPAPPCTLLNAEGVPVTPFRFCTVRTRAGYGDVPRLLLGACSQERPQRKPPDPTAPCRPAPRPAAQAILSILLNCPQLDLGAELSNFREFVGDFDPTMKGERRGRALSWAAKESTVAAHHVPPAPNRFHPQARPHSVSTPVLEVL